MKTIRRFIAASSILVGSFAEAHAGSAGTVSGLTLLEAPTARAHALGESLVASSNDISGFGYNPASLATMKSGQASFLYQKGLVDDSYGHFMIGTPGQRSGFGLSVGFYDGGSFDVDSGNGVHSVSAQRDLSLALGYARQFGRFTVGTAGKYISSEIAETARASAYAADFGLGLAVSRSLRLGGSVQNVGTKLKYADEGDDLPRMARFGAALSVRPGGVNTTLSVDGTYGMIEKDFSPAAGLEVSFGVLALRAGYRGGANREITAGTGFFAGRGSVDYSFGVASADLNASHRISYSLRFGGRPSMATQLASAARIERPQIPMAQQTASAVSKPAAIIARPAPVELNTAAPAIARRTPRTYEIKEGESLASIARDQYGDPRLWRTIYQANSHLFTDPADVKSGQKIVLP